VRARPADVTGSLVRPAVRNLVAYEPGKPIEELERELGLDRIAKLASNEGPYPPFAAALEAIKRTARQLNRYPDGGSYELRGALADRHGVRFQEVAPGAGADGVVDYLSQALLDPGDEVVCGWPSFPSYAIDARKMGAVPRLVALREHRYDLEAMLDAIGERTKIVFVCLPNNPTGTANRRSELDAFFAEVPEHVLTVIDQAYLEYVDDADYPDAIESYFKAGLNVVVLRTFSKIYGLAGLRVGYGIAPAAVVAEIAKVRRAFDVTTTGQAAALASLGDAAEIERRRRSNAGAMIELGRILRSHGLDPVDGAVANFLYAEIGADAAAFFGRLLHEGVIVRPLAAFGNAEAVRITAGTAEDHALLDAALSAVVGGGSQR
jgi:histidinol-phosphate aminotransferase